MNRLKQIMITPSTYVAAVIVTVLGCGVGGVIGAIAGGFIGHDYKLVTGCTLLWPGLEPSIVFWSMMGLIIGTARGGAIAGLITIYKIYNRNKRLKSLSADTISEIILSSLGVGIEVSVGMGLGAVIGSLKLPGVGSVI
ncbi:MAG: hypothetical protein ACRCXC_12600 [Legionella sp.]